MLNFIIAHEFGHIVHGHVLANSEDNFIEELYADETTNKDNWLTQLREFDADYYAAMLNTAITLGYWKEDRKVLSATFDLLFLSFIYASMSLQKLQQRFLELSGKRYRII